MVFIKQLTDDKYKEKGMLKKRNEYIDFLRGVACLLVVYTHSTNIFSYIGGNEFDSIKFLLSPFIYINQCGVPIFFLISGFLSEGTIERTGNYGNMMKKKAKSLLIPYFIWNIFYMLMEVVGYYIMPSAFDDISHESMIMLLIKMIGIPFIKGPIYEPLWFINSLFMFFCFLPVINFVVKKLPGFYIIIIDLLLMSIYVPLLYSDGYFINRSIPFFILGLYLAENKNKIFRIFNNIYKYRYILLLIFGFATYIIAYVKSINSDIHSVYRVGMTCHVITMTIIMGLCTSIFLIIRDISKIQIIRQILNCLSEYSFMIYVMHGKILSILQILFSRLLKQNGIIVILEYLLLPIIVILINIIIAFFMKRHLNKVYAVIVGKR